MGEAEPVPRCNIRDGLVWFEYKDFAEAARIYGKANEHSKPELGQLLIYLGLDLLHLHVWEDVWERCLLNAWLLHSKAGKAGILRGPTDSATGSVRPLPVPCSPAIAPVAWSSHGQRRIEIPSGPRSAPSMKGYLTDPNGYSSQGQLTHSLAAVRIAPTGPSRVAPGPTSFPSGYPAAGYAKQPHIGQVLPEMPMSPGPSDSLRNSSISALSTTVMLPEAPTSDSSRMTPKVPNTAYVSGSLSVTGVPRTDNTALDYLQAPTPPMFISDSIVHGTPPASSLSACYKVTITNLSLQATKELVGELVEQKTRIYVTLAQPDPIKLRKFKGQLHAYVKFTQKDDAETAVQRIRGFNFMGRTLYAMLEDLGGQ